MEGKEVPSCVGGFNVSVMVIETLEGGSATSVRSWSEDGDHEAEMGIATETPSDVSFRPFRRTEPRNVGTVYRLCMDAADGDEI